MNIIVLYLVKKKRNTEKEETCELNPCLLAHT